jgi:hypothetical protein
MLYPLGNTAYFTNKEEDLVIVDEYALEAYETFATRSQLAELSGYATSFYTVRGHIENIEKFNRPVLPHPTHPSWKHAVNHVRYQLSKLPQSIAIASNDIDEVPYISNSVAGFGYTGYKGDEGNYERARTIASRIAHEVKEGNSRKELVNSTPDIGFSRTQLSLTDKKPKIRNVWGSAFHYILLEGLYSYPLLDTFKSYNTFYYIGTNPLTSVPTTLKNMLEAEPMIYVIDWSSFDASVQPWEIRTAFDLLKEILIFDPHDQEKIFDFIVELFIYRKVIRPDGQTMLKDLGVPSGSAFTNMIDSICNYLRIQYIWHRLTNNFVTAFVQGDDTIVSVPASLTVNPADIDSISLEHGWRINWDKVKIGNHLEEVDFLSRTVKGGQMYRDEIEMFRKFVYPEYPIKDPKLTALRGKSLWFDGGASNDLLYKSWTYLESRYGIAEILPDYLQLHRM